MKKLISAVLALALLLSLPCGAFGADDEAEAAAEALDALGVFRGVGDNPDGTADYDLERNLTREEAVTLFVRSIGGEEDALSVSWELPFSDVSPWAVPYVGFAWSHGLTKGTSAATFDGKAPVTASQFLTYALRLLGYQSGKDFAWDAAWELSDRLQLTEGEYGPETAGFTRGDAAKVLNRTLAWMEQYIWFNDTGAGPTAGTEGEALICGYPPASPEGASAETRTVSVSYEEADMALRLPAGWASEIETKEKLAEEDGLVLFAIAFWPEEHPELRLKLKYLYEPLALCATGMAIQDITFESGLNATGLTETYRTEAGEEILWLTLIYNLVWNLWALKEGDPVPSFGSVVLEGSMPPELWELYGAEIMDIAASASFQFHVSGLGTLTAP